MTPRDLALKATQAAAKRFDFESASLVIEALAALGYTFEPPGVPGRYHESDEAKHALAKFAARETKLHLSIARDVLVAIDRFGLGVREPDKHPSGLETRELAITPVRKRAAITSELIGARQ